MQMVSASKYARAERELKPARVSGSGAKAVFEAAELEQDNSKPNHLIIAISSDRGRLRADRHPRKLRKGHLQRHLEDLQLP